MIRERWNDWPGDAQLSDVITRRVALPVKSIKSKPWPATVLSDLASSVPPLMARVPLFASTRSTFRSIPPIRRLRVPRRDPRHRSIRRIIASWGSNRGAESKGGVWFPGTRIDFLRVSSARKRSCFRRGMLFRGMIKKREGKRRLVEMREEEEGVKFDARGT